jgi:hypothetical protein
MGASNTAGENSRAPTRIESAGRIPDRTPRPPLPPGFPAVTITAGSAPVRAFGFAIGYLP